MSELPFVSVITETVTARLNPTLRTGLVDELEAPLEGLARQGYPADRFESVVVVDPAIGPDQREEVRRRYRWVRFAEAGRPNYFAAKMAGIDAARGDVVVMLDGDCSPAPRWLETLVKRLEQGVAAVAGRTRYVDDSRQARIFSVPDFGYVGERSDGAASGFNFNNVAFRRSVFERYRLDHRLRRNGGCQLLFHELQADDERVVYEPRAVMAHGNEQTRGFRFVGLHFVRGRDQVTMYEIDDRGVFRGTRPFRRFGLPALAAISLRRVAQDCSVLWKRREQIPISAPAVPAYCALALTLRVIEFAGMVAEVRHSRTGD
jgi:glycosyltransferase involved in cell wall biosynthesis